MGRDFLARAQSFQHSNVIEKDLIHGIVQAIKRIMSSQELPSIPELGGYQSE